MRSQFGILPGNNNPAAQDEIFGPILSVIGYDNVDDAVRIANDSIYGLSGQVYSAVESPRGELGAHIVSDGGTRPYRVHFREPSFINLQGTATMAIGGMIADVIASVASIDPVMGGCDR